MFNTLFGWREIRRRELKKREIEERHSISIVRLAEKKRTEKIEAWVPLKISFFSQQRRKWKNHTGHFYFFFALFFSVFAAISHVLPLLPPFLFIWVIVFPTHPLSLLMELQLLLIYPS